MALHEQTRPLHLGGGLYAPVEVPAPSGQLQEDSKGGPWVGPIHSAGRARKVHGLDTSSVQVEAAGKEVDKR